MTSELRRAPTRGGTGMQRHIAFVALMCDVCPAAGLPNTLQQGSHELQPPRRGGITSKQSGLLSGRYRRLHVLAFTYVVMPSVVTP
mmetsp:Transcript_28493/g.64518  ORF Transcript_28493/g.64518 Transcript_28493/m.64518 type:complete len:86 (-) Transcript_28493:1763-2020(-)